MSENAKIIKGVRRQRGEAALRHSRNSLSGSLLMACPEPPINSTIAAIEQWAAGVNVRAIQSAGEDPEEVIAVLSLVLRELGRLRQKAERSEDAVKVREKRLKDKRTFKGAPLEDPVSAMPWAYRELAKLAHAVATRQKTPKEARPLAKLLAQQGFLPCNAALEDIAERVKRKEQAE